MTAAAIAGPAVSGTQNPLVAPTSLSGSVPSVTSAKRLAMRGAMLAAALGAVSATYQQVAEARDRRRFAPPGRLVTIPMDGGCTFSSQPRTGRRS